MDVPTPFAIVDALPAWISFFLAISTFPIAFALRIEWEQYFKRREARRLGAVLPPQIPYRIPGGFDLVREVMRNSAKHMIGYAQFGWLEAHGPMCNLRIWFTDRYIVNEPEYIKRILATDFEGFEKGEEFRFQHYTLLGTGVFNADGDLWKFHRGMSRPFFSRERIGHFDIFDSHAEHVLDVIETRMKENYAIDWQDLASRFTMDCATAFLFGRDVCSLASPVPYPPASKVVEDRKDCDAFSQAFLAAQLLSAHRGRKAPLWPLFEFWGDVVKPHMRVLNDFIGPVIEDALNKRRAQTSGTQGEQDKAALYEDDTAGDTLLEQLVRMTDDPSIIRDETLNILLAGRDTTASTLTSSVYMLAEHPDICSRLRQEIMQVVGPNRRPSLEEIRQMKYLRAFINEVLRLYPAVPYNIRYSTRPTVWPSLVPGGKPWYVPPRTRIHYSVLVMHRRKDLWGPDAAEFDPDRFLDERLHKYLTPNPMIFLPFNAGPRICLGQQFAYNEVSFMLVRLLQRFACFDLAQEESDPSAVPPPGYAKTLGTNGQDKVKIRSHLTLFVEGGLWVRMRSAEGTE